MLEEWQGARLALLEGFTSVEEIVVEEMRGHQGREEQEGLWGHLQELSFYSR